MKISPPLKIKLLRLTAACAAIVAAMVPAGVRAAEDEIDAELAKLDRLIEHSSLYVEARRSRIELLENMRGENADNPEQRFRINCSLCDEYLAYSFDRTVEVLYDNIDIARQLGSRTKLDHTYIQLAELYANAGMYLEANVVLTENIDSRTLDSSLSGEYMLAKALLAYEFANSSKQEPITGRSLRNYEYYAEQLFENTEGASFDVLNNRGVWLMYNKRYDEARELYERLLADSKPSTREYAIAAYRLGEICDRTERYDEMMLWFIRSAAADIQSATKDNASLCTLANWLFARRDVARALRYIRISMDDALFYNAKLRPWQIAASLPHIELAAQEAELAKTRQLRTFTIIVTLLGCFLFVACICLWRMWLRTHRDRRAISKRNRQLDAFNRELSDLNKAISESNAVKEEYIGLFLSICSNYIDRLIEYRRHVRRKISDGKVAELLRETDSSSMVEEETKRFYEIFDSAFLKLYPTFVEDFNNLLADEERIVLHKGDLLNTELRIFALIRLGITDSSKIASLLRYSVNTIYNYRAKTKNRSKYRRDDFEEQVRRIGSFGIGSQTPAQEPPRPQGL